MKKVERDTNKPFQLQSFQMPDGRVYYRPWIFDNFVPITGADGNVSHYECDMYLAKDFRTFSSREDAEVYYMRNITAERNRAKGA